jgi:hypothetical protein
VTSPPAKVNSTSSPGRRSRRSSFNPSAPGGVLVPSATWKAVYSPQAGGTGVYVCANTSKPRCGVSVATLISMVGIDPFPALPASMKDAAIALPTAEAGRHGSRRRSPRQRQAASLLQQLFGTLERP